MDRLSSELAEPLRLGEPFWRVESHENAKRVIDDAVERYGQELREAIEANIRKWWSTPVGLKDALDFFPPHTPPTASDVQNGPNER